MTYVVTEQCIQCKYTDCVSVCPVDCFYEGANMLVIHPEQCIDCGVCEAECPVQAIQPDYEVADPLWALLNAEYASLWPGIQQVKAPLPDASDWHHVADKLALFDPAPPRADASNQVNIVADSGQ
jgi:ferredoxin